MQTIITETSRKKMLALIHLQKTKAAISDEVYVTILYNNAGVDSAAAMDNLKQFKSVINALNKVLIAQGQNPLGNAGNYNPREQRFLNAVRAKAQAVLGTKHYKSRLTGYLEKMHCARLEDCDARQLRRVMGFLSTLERRTGV